MKNQTIRCSLDIVIVCITFEVSTFILKNTQVINRGINNITTNIILYNLNSFGMVTLQPSKLAASIYLVLSNTEVFQLA